MSCVSETNSQENTEINGNTVDMNGPCRRLNLGKDNTIIILLLYYYYIIHTESAEIKLREKLSITCEDRHAFTSCGL